MYRKITISIIAAFLFFSSVSTTLAKDPCYYYEVRDSATNHETFDLAFCVALPSPNVQVDLQIEVTRVSGGGPFNWFKDEVIDKSWTGTTFTLNETFTRGYDPVSKKNYICGYMQEINRKVEEMKLKWRDRNADYSFCEVDNVKTQRFDAKGFRGFVNFMEDTIHDQLGIGKGHQPSVLMCASGAINTALGCLDPTDLPKLIGQFLTVAIGFSGAIALILLLYGFFTVTTSAGIPDKVNAGKGVITSALGGLIFIVLSVILLKIIGVDILQLPGLSG